LSFHPHHSVKTIVRNLIENMSKCKDWDNPNYYNIQVFKGLDERASGGEPVGAFAESSSD
jgi:hypothetical protein